MYEPGKVQAKMDYHQKGSNAWKTFLKTNAQRTAIFMEGKTPFSNWPMQLVLKRTLRT